MSVWSGYEPLAVVRERAGDRLVTAVNAALTESATSLTAALAGAPEAFEQHVARRVDSGPPGVARDSRPAHHGRDAGRHFGRFSTMISGS